MWVFFFCPMKIGILGFKWCKCPCSHNWSLLVPFLSQLQMQNTHTHIPETWEWIEMCPGKSYRCIFSFFFFFLTSAKNKIKNRIKTCGLDTIWKLRSPSIFALYHFLFCFKTIRSRPAFCVCGVTNDVPRALMKKKIKYKKLLVASKLSRAVEHCSILKVLAIASPVSPPHPSPPWSYSVRPWLLLLLLLLYLFFIFMWIELPVKSFFSFLLLLFPSPPSVPSKLWKRITLWFHEPYWLDDPGLAFSHKFLNEGKENALNDFIF